MRRYAPRPYALGLCALLAVSAGCGGSPTTPERRPTGPLSASACVGQISPQRPHRLVLYLPLAQTTTSSTTSAALSERLMTRPKLLEACLRQTGQDHGGWLVDKAGVRPDPHALFGDAGTRDTLLKCVQPFFDAAPVTQMVEVRFRRPGTLPEHAISSTMRAARDDVSACYDRQLAARGHIAHGHIRTRFLIGPDGTVSDLVIEENRTGSDGLGCCVAQVISKLTFQPPGNNGFVSVVYPFDMLLQ